MVRSKALPPLALLVGLALLCFAFGSRERQEGAAATSTAVAGEPPHPYMIGTHLPANGLSVWLLTVVVFGLKAWGRKYYGIEVTPHDHLGSRDYLSGRDQHGPNSGLVMTLNQHTLQLWNGTYDPAIVGTLDRYIHRLPDVAFLRKLREISGSLNGGTKLVGEFAREYFDRGVRGFAEVELHAAVCGLFPHYQFPLLDSPIKWAAARLPSAMTASFLPCLYTGSDLAAEMKEFINSLVGPRLPRQTNLMMHVQLHARMVMEDEIRAVTGDRSLSNITQLGTRLLKAFAASGVVDRHHHTGDTTAAQAHYSLAIIYDQERVGSLAADFAYLHEELFKGIVEGASFILIGDPNRPFPEPDTLPAHVKALAGVMQLEDADVAARVVAEMPVAKNPHPGAGWKPDDLASWEAHYLNVINRLLDLGEDGKWGGKGIYGIMSALADRSLFTVNNAVFELASRRFKLREKQRAGGTITAKENEAASHSEMENKSLLQQLSGIVKRILGGGGPSRA